MDRAARIAVRETKKFLEGNSAFEKVFLVCFGRSATETYSNALCEALRE